MPGHVEPPCAGIDRGIAAWAGRVLHVLERHHLGIAGAPDVHIRPQLAGIAAAHGDGLDIALGHCGITGGLALGRALDGTIEQDDEGLGLARLHGLGR